MSEPQAPGPERGKLSAGSVASIGGAGVLLIFILQNREDVRFHFLSFSFTWPLWLYTVVVAACGAVVWLGLGVLRRHRRRQQRRGSRQ